METLSSARLTNNNSIQVSRKIENSEKNMSKSKGQEHQDRCALMDLTNDSPIVGLADGGNIVEKQSAKKQRESRMKNTPPGSGEALLRCQVKTLMQKVDEDATPTLPSINPSLLIQQQSFHQVVNEEDSDCEKSVITRSLFIDFSENSQVSDALEEGSVVSSCCSIKKLSEDDDSSMWSMQVNAEDHEEEEEEEYEKAEITEDDEEEDYEKGRLLIDELCEGLNNISVNERIAPTFEGKHTRFVYNSDDELVKEEEEESATTAASPNILCLKGLPTPKGKHLRFSEEDE